jgi:hypothetical protein
MATLEAQLTEIEFLIHRGKPRVKRRGYDQARALFKELSAEKQAIDATILTNEGTASESDSLRTSSEQLQAYMKRLDSLFQFD